MGIQHIIKLPDIGEGTAEAEIARWHVSPGQKVREDELLVDMTTDKATVEIPSPVSGTVISLAGVPGDMIAVGANLVVLEIAETLPEAAAKTESPPLPQNKPSNASTSSEVARRATESQRPTVSEPVKVEQVREAPMASPAVRKKAKDYGIELHLIQGTGPRGRVLAEDVDHYVTARHRNPIGGDSASPPAVSLSEVREIKLVGVRRAIAQRMQEAKRHIPHFGYIEEIDVTALEELREHLNGQRTEGQPKLTLLPFLVTALVRALPSYPQMNARFDDDAGIIRQFKAAHVGIATQTPNGLLVPVLRDAQRLDVWGIAKEILRLAADSRAGKVKREELVGSTISISSLGALGGIATTPIINYPEVAILGPNRIIERPVVRKGQVVVRKIMNMSCSFDHRVIDGQDAAEFVSRIRTLIEQPALLFMRE
ncbi:MAG: 2-oxo acid dehydrogenase subunit E2 [Rhodospirillaceae bacterium]|nr:MAG: 2-oxo acid dehydrogenase subunit E2 [Rhodospirillaceae bacterium]